MNRAEYDRMYALEDTYWWFQGRQEIIVSMLETCGALASTSTRPLVIDLGCGTGLMLKRLASRARMIGLDYSPLALSYCRRRTIGDLARFDAVDLPVRDESVDAVLALDMLEHIEDDQRVIDEMARVLRPGGVAVLAVPAHPFLWSEHDEALHHFRRYRRRELAALFDGHRLRVERLTYAIAFTFVPIALFRLVTRHWRRVREPKAQVIILPLWANRLLTGLLRVEARLLRRWNLPCGVSLIAIARKDP
jgi:SAM-dependent methyltransferase